MGKINVEQISKQFGKNEILKQVSLDVEDGEFMTLVGPSGCGKSTLLRIIAGLENQDAGHIHIGKQNVDHVRPSHRDLAMVFQSYALYPHLSVLNNMMTPLVLRDLNFFERLPWLGRWLPKVREKKKELEQIVHSTATTLKIEPFLSRKPAQLSGGQRQRVALGRAMVREPQAFLMDEPLSNLDAALRVHMRAELAELHRTLATTFIYVTHDQAEALTMSDRMAVMMEGEILQIDTPEEIYHNPNHLKVAEFVGSPKMNTFPAQIDEDGNISCLGKYLQQQTNLSQQKATIGIRPENLRTSLKPSNSMLSHSIQVLHKENLGSDVYIHGVLQDHDLRMISRATPLESHQLQIGEQAYVSYLSKDILLFGEDNQRISLSSPFHHSLVHNA